MPSWKLCTEVLREIWKVSRTQKSAGWVSDEDLSFVLSPFPAQLLCEIISFQGQKGMIWPYSPNTFQDSSSIFP